MNDIFNTAAEHQSWAREVIAETRIVEIWSSVGAAVNLVGSLRTGLLIRKPDGKLDIDFHIYTDPFSLSDSFLAVSRLAENPRIRSISYANLLEAEDRCLEWHAIYESARGPVWQIDMIHILKNSFYDGYFEKVADRIAAVLTPETREAILTVKHSLPPEIPAMGIEICQAVIEGGVRNVTAFRKWKEEHSGGGIIAWMP